MCITGNNSVSLDSIYFFQGVKNFKNNQDGPNLVSQKTFKNRRKTSKNLFSSKRVSFSLQYVLDAPSGKSSEFFRNKIQLVLKNRMRIVVYQLENYFLFEKNCSYLQNHCSSENVLFIFIKSSFHNKIRPIYSMLVLLKKKKKKMNKY